MIEAIAFAGWTEAAVAQMKELWSQGYSASQIGAMLGTSRNSVLSKVHRLHLPERDCDAGARLSGKRSMKRAAAALPPSAPDEPEPVTVPGVTPVNIGHGQCRWPIGEPQDPSFHFCANPKASHSSYCAFHNKRAWASGARPSRRERAEAEAAFARTNGVRKVFG